MNKKKINLNLKWIYFSFAVIASLGTSMMPLHYLNLGYSDVEIASLINITYVAALFLPLIGMIVDKSQKPVVVIRVSLFVIVLISLSMYWIGNYVMMLGLILMLSIARLPLFGVLDKITLDYSQHESENFGSFKVGSSFGYGVAMLISIPVMAVLGEKSFLLIIIGLAFYSIYTIGTLPLYPLDKKSKAESDAKIIDVFKNKKVLAIIAYQSLFFGTLSVKFGYQAILLEELSGNALVPSIALLLSTIPEVIFLKYVQRFIDRIYEPILLGLAVLILALQIYLFSFVESVPLLFVIALLHGVGVPFHLVIVPNYLRSRVAPKLIATTLLLTVTIQSIVGLGIATFIITPLFIEFGVRTVFLGMSVIVLTALFPLGWLVFNHVVKEKKKI